MNTFTNSEWLQQFEAHLKRRFPERSTAKHYVSDLRIFIRYHPGPLPETTPQDVDAFVDHQYAQGLAPTTVRRRVAALKAFFDFLGRETQAPNHPNPVSVQRYAGRQPQRLPRDLSDEEVELLLAVVHSTRDLAMIALMLYAGLRVSEVAALCAADISVPQDPEAPIRLRVMGKGRKERLAYLCREGYQPLAEYLQEHPPADPQVPLFRNRLGHPITVGGIQERIHHYAQLSGVKVSCHRLRHTYGRWMAENEMPVLTLARLLGHTDLQTTQRYIAGADPQVRRSYEAAMARSLSSAKMSTETQEFFSAGTTVSARATVTREEPCPFEGDDWMPEWPTWLRERCLDWVRHKWYGWKPSQRSHHAGTRLRELRLFWRFQLPRRRFEAWDDLTTADLDAFVEAQLARGLAPKTVNSILDTLYGLLRYLVAQGRLPELPQRPELKLPDALPQHLKPQEVVTLEDYVAQRQQVAQDAEWLDIALYYLLAHGGLRISEALDLQVKDLDLVARRVRVRDGKGRKDRVVFLTEKAAAGVRRYLETVPHAPQDLVLSWEGRPLTYKGAYRRIRRLGEAAGVEKVSPQRLRHTYATLLLNNGMDIEGLRRLMGHKDLSTTLICARLADRTVEQQYRAAMKRVTHVNSM